MRDVFRSLRIRNYRLFAIGQLVSLIGTWAQAVGQDWLVLRLTGGDGVALGISMALQFGPTLLFGLWGGVLADRLPKRRLLIAVQAYMGVLAAALAVLTATGVVQLWMVYLLAALLGLATVVDTPTRQSFVSEMVQPEDVPNAIALNSATFNTARIIGPAVAAVGIAKWGVTPVFIANAVSYIGVIAGLLRMRDDELRHHGSAAAKRVSGQVREGLRYVLRHRDVLAAVVLTGLVAMFGMNMRVTLALMADGPLGGGAGQYGLLTAMLAGGALMGGLLAARRRRPRQAVLVLAAVAFGASEVLLALMPNVVTFCVVLVPTGMLAITYTSTANASVQLASTDAVRGRVMAIYSVVFLGGTPLGGPLSGWVAERWSPRVSLGTGGFLTALAGLVVGAALARGAERPLLRRRAVTVAPPLDAVR